jgi:HK97 family phage major capsid protein
MRTKDLLERRSRIVADMRSLTETPTGDGGDLSSEQAMKFDNLKSELTALEKSIERQQVVDEAERRMAGQRITTTGDGKLDDELRNFSLRKAILTQMPNVQEDCSRERELSAEIARRSGRAFQGVAVPLSVFEERVEQRVLTTALPAAGPGSNIIATDLLSGQFIDRLRSAMVVRRLGATVLNGLVGNADIPRLKASASSGWVAENSAITASDPQYDKISLTPKHCGAIVEFSRNLLLQSSPDIKTLLRQDFAQILAAEVDRVALKGGTTVNEPTGIIATSGVTSVSIGTPTWAGILSLIAAVESNDGQGNAFVGNANVVKKLRSTAKVTSTDSQMIQESPTELAGYPFAQTNLMPTDLNSPGDRTSLIFGRWSELVLGFWSELDVLVSPYDDVAFSKGNIMIRGMMTVDVKLRHPLSFAFSSDVIYL